MRLERLSARLEPANVAKLLSRGFALVLKEGRLVARSAAAAEGDGLRIALGEGWLDARVTARDAGPDPLPGRRDPAPQEGEAPATGTGVDPPARHR